MFLVEFCTASLDPAHSALQWRLCTVKHQLTATEERKSAAVGVEQGKPLDLVDTCENSDNAKQQLKN